MYYEEEWIDGVYCYRTSPDGEWIPLKPQPNAPIPPAMTDHAHLWPLKKHDGRAEAALLAWYGSERLQGRAR